MGVDDQMEIFHNRDTRDLVIEVEFPGVVANQVSKVRLTTVRQQLGNWRGEFFYDSPPLKLTGPAGPSINHFGNERGAIVEIDFAPLFELCETVSAYTTRRSWRERSSHSSAGL